MKRTEISNSNIQLTAVLHILQENEALILLAGPFLRTPVGNIAAEVTYETAKAKFQPSLALENIREEILWAHTTPVRCSRTAGLSGCQRNQSN